MQVLVLSDTFQPLYTCGVQRAITLLYLGKAVSVQDSDRVLRSPSVSIRIPKAIRLLVRAVIRHYQSLRPHRHAIFRRDHNTCQYCGRKGSVTLDHVIPKSRGGSDTWENLVSACFECNNKKSNHTPEEVGMRLLRPPRPPAPFDLSDEFWDLLLGL